MTSLCQEGEFSISCISILARLRPVTFDAYVMIRERNTSFSRPFASGRRGDAGYACGMSNRRSAGVGQKKSLTVTAAVLRLPAVEVQQMFHMEGQPFAQRGPGSLFHRGSRGVCHG